MKCRKCKVNEASKKKIIALPAVCRRYNPNNLCEKCRKEERGVMIKCE